jgi:hypothetical protein
LIGQLPLSGFELRDGIAPLTLSPSLTKIGIRIMRFNSSLQIQNLTASFMLINIDYIGKKMGNIIV